MYKLLFPIRAAVALVAAVIWVVIMVAAFHVARLFGYRAIDKIPRCFHRGCCAIIGVSVEHKPGMSLHRPTLYVGNHISYLDIFALGGYLPGYFIAKSDVASWPVLGKLAKLQNTLFFERNSKRAAQQISIMEQHLRDGGNLILFPEGGSSYGTSVKRYKTSLFKAAEIEDVDVMVQPFAVSYTHCRGKAMSSDYRNYFAWYGGMPFVPHFLAALGAPRVRAQVMYAEPVKVSFFESRKACALHCQRKTAAMLEESLREGDELEKS